MWQQHERSEESGYMAGVAEPAVRQAGTYRQLALPGIAMQARLPALRAEPNRKVAGRNRKVAGRRRDVLAALTP